MKGYTLQPLASLADVAALRAEHRASLTALPEFFLEMAVERSRVFAVAAQTVVGYLTADPSILTAFYLVAEHRGHADAVVEQAVETLGLERAWACTFDPIALDAFRRTSGASEVLGLSFRTLEPVSLPDPDPLPLARPATMADVDRVLAVNHPEVFDDPADIPRWIQASHVTLFEHREDLVGFGLCTPVGPHTPAADVGVCVRPPEQRRGLGAWIVRQMTARATARGLVPTAGCAAGNTASRRTLERAGFVADHRLLEFDL